jgi:hypothetical protein
MSVAPFLSGTPPGSSSQWVKWTDPVEGAFTLDVPAGWQVTGGTRRPLPNDQRFIVEARAADGGIQIFLGDEKIPTFVQPEGYFMMPPPEGSLYAPGMVIMRFRNGAEFAREYGQDSFTSLTGAPAQLERSQRDPMSEAQFPRQGLLPGTEVSVGIARFFLTWPQGPGIGLISAAVTRTPLPLGQPGGLWNVPLISRIALMDFLSEGSAVSTWRHMLGSFMIGSAATTPRASTQAPGAPGAPGPAGMPPAAPPGPPGPMPSPGAAGVDPGVKALMDAQKDMLEAQRKANEDRQRVYSRINAAFDDYIKG